MSRLIALLVWFFVTFTCMVLSASGQTALSLNSGINSADTWVTMDLTTQTQSSSITLPTPVYNPSTKTSSNTLSVAPTPRVFHVESGYDVNGGLVMNLWPSSGQSSPYTSDSSAISVIRFAGGQMTVFDQNGNPLPVVLPNANMPANWPLSLLGSNPGASVVASLVVPNIQSRATAMNAALTLTSGPTRATLGVPMPKGGTNAWTYVQSGSNWIAQKVTIPISTAQITSSLTMQFGNVNWNDNTANDAARAALPSTKQPARAATTSTPSALTAPTPDVPDTVGGTAIDDSKCNTTNNYLQGGAQNIVFQHGIWSNGCAWTRMADWLNQDFSIGNEIIPTLSSNSNLGTSQGGALINEVNSVGGKNYILVGHSQGGLVSRYAAQQLQNSPSNPFEGVVTVDTPHQGANLTLNSPLIVSGLLDWGADSLWSWDGCATPYDDWNCALASLMVTGSTAIEPLLYAGVGATSWSELQPGSMFLNNLNSQPENFKQAAVIGLTPQRFAFSRIAANAAFQENPEDGLGERNTAQATEIFYDELVGEEAIWLAIAAYDCSEGDPDDCEVDLENIAFLGGFITIFDTVDFAYNVIIDLPGDGSSDAIVQGPSQYYPYPTANQYTIQGADSHTGALKSDYVHTALDAALRSAPFNVPQYGSCSTLSVPSTPDSVVAQASSGTIPVTATSGCAWSAISQASWLSISSGVNGAGAGTVTFAIAANLSTVPRQGIIKVGTGTLNALFTVTQAGAGAGCTYSLSPGPQVAAAATGGSSTVQVTSSTGCPWTAVSNASWLTISSGTSGTGSGSFSWTATSNPTSSDRSGTIAVMNQTLTVIDGSPVGTPGAGTVTIQGSPQEYCPPTPEIVCAIQDPTCKNPPPPKCIYESGTVSITVGGDTFTVSYAGATPSATSLATAFVGLMTYANSPIIATSSGPTTSITSAIKGAATNYALTASSTSGGRYFSGPAFIAVPKTAQLTGGTD